jgi:hypothetical protein
MARLAFSYHMTIHGTTAERNQLSESSKRIMMGGHETSLAWLHATDPAMIRPQRHKLPA